MQSTFGLSNGVAAIVTALSGSRCSYDYITIPSAMTATLAKTTPNALATAVADRFCGRFLMTHMADGAGTTHNTVCTRVQPYVVSVHFDADEVTDNTPAPADATKQEQFGFPSAIIGFDLTYAQASDCTS